MWEKGFYLQIEDVAAHLSTYPSSKLTRKQGFQAEIRDKLREKGLRPFPQIFPTSIIRAPHGFWFSFGNKVFLRKIFLLRKKSWFLGSCAVGITDNEFKNPKKQDIFRRKWFSSELELELELIEIHMAQKPMLRAEVGMRVRCANNASAEWFRRERSIGQIPRTICKKRGICGCCALHRTI